MFICGLHILFPFDHFATKEQLVSATSIRPTHTTQALLHSLDKAGEKDKRSISISQIVLPIIIALVSFLLLPAKLAIVITAAAIIGVVVYHTRTNKPPSPASEKGSLKATPTAAPVHPSPGKHVHFGAARGRLFKHTSPPADVGKQLSISL